MEWAEDAAYTELQLLPYQFYKLTPLELEKLLTAYNKKLERQRWDMAYWVSNMISVHTKHSVQPYELMKPYTKNYNVAKEKAEAKAFFESFYKERNEIEKQRKEE